jgi:hypothetical protein
VVFREHVGWVQYSSACNQPLVGCNDFVIHPPCPNGNQIADKFYNFTPHESGESWNSLAPPLCQETHYVYYRVSDWCDNGHLDISCAQAGQYCYNAMVWATAVTQFVYSIEEWVC